MSGNRDLLFVALAVAVSGCATQTQWITFPGNDGGKGVTLEAWLQQHPLKPDEEVGLVELSRGETASSHLVQIRKREGLHTHDKHDAIAILLKGQGILAIGEQRLELKPGSIVTVPRGVPHSFVNKAQEPAVAYVLFTPAFDGKDRVPVEEESLVRTETKP